MHHLLFREAAPTYFLQNLRETMEAFLPAPAAVTTNHHQQHKEEGSFAVVDDSSTIADFFCRPTLNK